jgi:hypothetical protein
MLGQALVGQNLGEERTTLFIVLDPEGLAFPVDEQMEVTVLVWLEIDGLTHRSHKDTSWSFPRFRGGLVRLAAATEKEHDRYDCFSPPIFDDGRGGHVAV